MKSTSSLIIPLWQNLVPSFTAQFFVVRKKASARARGGSRLVTVLVMDDGKTDDFVGGPKR